MINNATVENELVENEEFETPVVTEGEAIQDTEYSDTPEGN